MRCNESGRIDNRCGRHWSRSFRCRSSTCIATAIRLCTAVRLSDFASVVTATLGAREDSVEETELADLATKHTATAWLCTTFGLSAAFGFSAAFGLSDFASVIAHSITNAQADFRNVDLDQRLAAARIALSTARGFCTTLWLCTTIWLCTAIWLSDFASVFSRFAALSITTTT